MEITHITEINDGDVIRFTPDCSQAPTVIYVTAEYDGEKVFGQEVSVGSGVIEPLGSERSWAAPADVEVEIITW